MGMSCLKRENERCDDYSVHCNEMMKLVEGKMKEYQLEVLTVPNASFFKYHIIEHGDKSEDTSDSARIRQHHMFKDEKRPPGFFEESTAMKHKADFLSP